MFPLANIGHLSLMNDRYSLDKSWYRINGGFKIIFLYFCVVGVFRKSRWCFVICVFSNLSKYLSLIS